MPVAQAALEKADIWSGAQASLMPGISLTHVLVDQGTAIRALGDIFWMRWPWGTGSAFSAGDVVLIAGLFIATQSLMGAGKTGAANWSDQHA